MEPLISVIIPVYNAKNYLHVCLQSVLKQTYNNLEIIVINDGSTDTSFQICEEFSSLDPRIKVIHQENRGVCAARNVGLDHVTGQYVLHLDNDDYLSDYCIAELYKLLIEYRASIALGNVIKFENGQNHLMGNSKFNSDIRMLNSKEALMNIYEHGSGLSLLFVLITGKLYNVKLFENIRFPEGKAFDDEHVNYKLFIKSNRIIFTPKSVYTHNIRVDSLSRIPYALSHLDKISMLEERLSVFKSLEIRDLYQKTLYLYFHILVYNLVHLRKHFPRERDLLIHIKEKLVTAKESLVTLFSISLKAYLVIHLYYYFPSVIILKMYLKNILLNKFQQNVG